MGAERKTDRPNLRVFGPGAGDGSPTVQSVIDDYLVDLRLRVKVGAIGKGSLDAACHYLGRFAEMFGARFVTECRSGDFANWLLAHPEWDKPNTRHDAMARVVACFKWAAGENLIDGNPYRANRRLAGRAVPREAMSKDEFRTVLLAAKQEPRVNVRGKSLPGRCFRLLFWFLWQTGCRTCEGRCLTWDQIDWQEGVARLSKHKTAHVTNEDRVIALHAGVLFLLRMMVRKRQPGQTHVFVNTYGKPLTKDRVAKLFRRYADRAGIRKEITAYCARHGFCVEGIERGLSNRQLADLLGHRTTRYVDLVYGRCSRTKTEYLRGLAGRMKGGGKPPQRTGRGL